LAEGVKFCGECGAPVAGAAGPSPDSPPDVQSSIRYRIRDAVLRQPGEKSRISRLLMVIGFFLLAPAALGIIFSVILIFASRRAGQIDVAGGILFGLISCVGGILLWFLITSLLSRKSKPGWDEKYAPLLAGFPLDLIFSGTLKQENGDEPLQIVSSVYHFDFATFVQDPEKRQLTYRSRTNSEYRVEVLIYRYKPVIEVSKFRGENQLWHATGATLDAAIAEATSTRKTSAAGSESDEAEPLSLTPSFATRFSLHVTPQ
jgi:hypothetical protein